MAYEDQEVQVEETDFTKPDEETARAWPFVIGAIVLIAWFTWSYAPAKAKEKFFEPVMQQAREEAAEVVGAAYRERDKIMAETHVRVTSRINETKEPLIRLIMENADRYGLMAERTPDFVKIRPK